MKKGLWNIANGKDGKPWDAALASDWEVKDKKAQAIIKLELYDTYIHHMNGCDATKETWDQLNTLFVPNSKSSNFGLLIEFLRLEMKSHAMLASHLN